MPAALRQTKPPRRVALAPLLVASAMALQAPPPRRLANATAALPVVAAAVQYGPPATGPISWERAKCMLRGKKIAFIGDSNSRYHYFSFNVFLDTGNLRYWKGKGSYNQDGGGSGWGTGGLPDYDGECKNSDCRSTWTDYSTRGGNAKHQQEFSFYFDDLDATSEFFFIKTTWFDKDEWPSGPNMADLAKRLEGYDLVVFNSGWWELKDWSQGSGGPAEAERGYVNCGDKWTSSSVSSCAKGYQGDVEKVVKELLKPAKAGVWRECSCCGDRKAWKEEVVELNDVARSVINKESSVEFAPVFDLYGEDDLYGKQLPDGTTDGATVDGTHATPVFYHRWTMRVLAAAERQLKTGCLLPGALDPTPRPVPRCVEINQYRGPRRSRRRRSRRGSPSLIGVRGLHLARVAAMASARERRGSGRSLRCVTSRARRGDGERASWFGSRPRALDASLPAQTQRPTEEPGDPTRKPTKKPTPEPSREPTYRPTSQPSREPTDKPTPRPSTSKPTPEPTTPKPTTTPLGCPRVRLADDCPEQRPPSCGAGGHSPGDFCEGDGACDIAADVKNCAYSRRRRLQDESNAAVYVVRVAAPTMAPTAKPRPKKSSSSASDVPAWGFAVAAAALVLFVVAICACYVAGKEARACLDGDQEDVKPRQLPKELRKARSQGPLPAKVDDDYDSDDDLARLRMLRAKKGLPPILREETKVGEISPLTPDAKRRSRGRASTPDAEALAAAAAASARRPDRRRGLGPADGAGLAAAGAAGASSYWARKSPDRRAAPVFSPATGRAPPPSTRSLAAAGAAAGAGAALARRRSSDMETVRRSTSDMDRSAPSPPRAHRRTPSDMDIRGDSPVDLEMVAGAGARGLARDRRPAPPRDVAWSPPRTSSELRRPREAPLPARSASSHSSARSPSYYRDRASRTASRDYSRPSRQTSAETFATPSSLAYAAPAASRPDRRRGLGPADGAGAAGSAYAAPTAPRRSAPRAVAYATCVDAFRAVRPGELSLRVGDRVAILDSSDAVWWRGSCRGAEGRFPCYHVDHVSTSPDASVVAATAAPRRYY